MYRLWFKWVFYSCWSQTVRVCVCGGGVCDQCVCRLQCSAQDYSGSGRMETENINKKISSSQKSNPLLLQSYMCHVSHVLQHVTQDKPQKNTLSYLYNGDMKTLLGGCVKENHFILEILDYFWVLLSVILIKITRNKDWNILSLYVWWFYVFLTFMRYLNFFRFTVIIH